MQGHILSTYKAVLSEAQKRGLIAYNPASSIRITSRKRHRVLMRIGGQIPDRPDIRAILGEATGKWRALFMTAAFSGMRQSELRALTWSSVDLDNRCIHVRERADMTGKVGSCKSFAGYRRIQIPDDLVNELRRWRLICPPSLLNLVFPDDDGNVMTRSDIYRPWCAVQCRINIVRATGGAKYTFHALRHFYASIMIHAGTPPKRLQELLGHATLSMTMDTYSHLFPAGDDEAARINIAMTAVLAA
jgi:integrase